MDKKIKNLDGRIAELGAEISRLEARKAEAESRIAAIKEALPAHMEEMKRALVDGGDILSLEARRKELVGDKERDGLLVAGLAEKMEGLEQQLSEAIEARSDRFAELVSPWLAQEAKTYNDLAERLTTTIRRLAACHNLLKELGRIESFQQGLGDGGRYLWQTRMVTLGNGFQPSDIDSSQCRLKLRPSPHHHETVFSEITR